MSYTYNAADIEKTLLYCLNNNTKLVADGLKPLALEIQGEAGIGKTSMILDLCDKLGIKCVKLNLAQQEEISDLVGYPIREYLSSNGHWYNEKQLSVESVALTNQTRTSWCPPKWVPSNLEDPGLLILDDWTRADPRFIQATMELIDRGTYLSWSLPKNWTIVLTSNPGDGEYNVQELDAAQLTRFFRFKMKYDEKVWARWAEKAGIDSRCINFVLLHPECVNHNLNPRSITNFFNSIKYLENFSSEESRYLIQILGDASVGNEFVQTFLVFIDKKMDLVPSPQEYFTSKDKSILNKYKELVGNLETQEYRSSIASVIANRIINWCVARINKKEWSKKYLTKITDIYEEQFLKKDILFYMTKELSWYSEIDPITSNEAVQKTI